MKNVFKLMAIGICILSIAGCGSKKQKKVDLLEQQNKQLQQQLAEEQQKLTAVKNKYEDRLDALRYEKDTQIDRLQQNLEQNLTVIERQKEDEIEDLRMAKERLQMELQKEIDEYKAKLSITDQGLVVTFLDEVLFDSGKAEVRGKGLAVLDSVASVLADESSMSMVRIEGHTDNVPIKYSRWQSNWDLSCARALSVLHYFTEQKGLNPKRFYAAGYGEYRPVESNDTKEGRAQNRRVEIVILPEKLKEIKKGVDKPSDEEVGIDLTDQEPIEEDELAIIDMK